MAIVLKDRVKQTASAPGTGTITLGSTPNGFQAFSAIGNGNVTYFAIVDAASGAWEVNYGTYTSSGTTLSRNATPLSSSNAGALVNFTGTVDVFCTYPSEKSIYEEVSGNVLIDGGPITVIGTGVSTYTTFGAALAELYANVAGFAQMYAQNLSDDATASTDIVAYNDLGDGTNNFIDMGISSSNYSDITYPIFTSGSGYVYNDGGELIIGSATDDLLLFAGGIATTNWALRVDKTTQAITTKAGLAVGGTLGVTGATTFSSTVALSADPTTALQAATKQYVDTQAAQGFTVHASVVLATTTALSNAPTYVAGVYTATTNGKLTIDGVDATNGQRVLIKNEALAQYNGVYDVTSAGSAGSTYQLTRSSDMNTVGTGEVANNAYFFVTGGTTGSNKYTAWVLAQTAAITLGVTPLPFDLFSSQLVYTGGTNIDVTGTVISLTGTVAATNGGTGTNTVATGDLIYGSGTNAWGKLGVGAAYKSLIVNAAGTLPEWNAVALNQSGAVSGALGATNGGTGLSSYALGDTIYSSAANTLLALAGNTTTTKKFLIQTGTGAASAAPSWGTVDGADVSGNIAGSAGSVANALTLGTYLTGTSFNGSAAVTATVDATSANTASKVVARDASGDFAAGTITATLSGAATSATTATNLAGGANLQIPYQTASGTTSFITAASGTNYVLNYTGSAFSWVAGTISGVALGSNLNALTLGTYLTGTSYNGSTTVTAAVDATSVNTASKVVARDASGNFAASTITAALTGNASTATTLATARAIYGNNFDGSAALTQVIASTYGGTGNGFTKFSGPTTAERTFTLPDATATILTSNAAVTAVQGGTGQTSYAVGDLLYASTTTALSKLADVATGNALISGGVGVAPSYGKIGLTTHVSGTLPVANGGTNLTAFTANGIVYASSTSALATGSALTFDGTNLTNTGSETAARFIPSGSTVATNGLYLPTTNSLGLSTNSTERMRFDASGNVGIGLTPVASNGILQLNSYASVQALMEKATVSATAATGTINFDAATQAVLYYTTNASGNWTMNVRASSTVSLNTMMQTGQSLTIAFMNTNGSTAYYASAFTIDGSSVTPKWQGGTAPTGGNASAIDAYIYTIVKTASATYTVLASITKFA